MRVEYPITKAQSSLLAAAEAQLQQAQRQHQTVLAGVLASLDLTIGTPVAYTDTYVTIETPDVPETATPEASV